jgi:glycosyltransferase involved in cell wall biosynthesis
MGVDREFLDPAVPIDPSGGILCVARLDRRKGHAVLLEALEKLRALGLTPDLKLVGDGPYREQLKSDVRCRGLQSQVHFAGWLTEREVRESLDRCRLFVLPSHSEGLPVSIMEAFARARPVIASGVAGIPELLYGQRNGLLVPPGDASALAAAIQALLGLPVTKLFELGMLGRAEVLSRFQSVQNAQSLVQLWRECES